MNPEQRAYFENAALFGMVSEALTSYATTHDFSQYDNDNDGDIDLVTILYAGPDTGWGSFWWAYRWEFSLNEAQTTTFNGKRLKQFVFQFVSRRDQSDFDPHTLLHETGHAFGLADYYDYDESVGPSGGVGGLDMMDANWGNQNAFSRWLLDWITPEVISSGPAAPKQLVASGSTLNTNKAIAIFPRLGDTTSPTQELFIIENRFRIGNDDKAALLPNNGLLIWHVIANPNSTDDGFSFDNSFSDRKLIRLIRADSDEDFPAGERAGAGTFFNAPKWFGPSSTPNSNSYSGLPTSVIVQDISAPGETMTVKVGFDAQSPPHPIAAAADGALSAPSALRNAVTARSETNDPARLEAVDLATVEESFEELRGASTDQLKMLWDAATKDQAQGSNRQSEVLKQLILTQWASRDGFQAVAAVLRLPQSDFSREVFARVMETWANHDASSAAGWYFTPANRTVVQDRKLIAGEGFAKAVFHWWSQNDFKKAVAMLDKVQASELAGALAAIKAVATAEGVPSALLKAQISQLKGNRTIIEAVDHVQQEKKLLEAPEVTPRMKEQFRGLIERSHSLK